MEIEVGRVIDDKYRLVRLLGRGSMGEVWAAHHQTLGEYVAVKLLTQSDASQEAVESQESANARFQFEAQVAARLSRKTRHIVRVTDHGEQAGLAYLVMELLDGETLEALLAREGRLDLPRLASIVRQVARALGQAHGEGVFHRDLKPANVFLTQDEDGQLVAKLLDFGIARAIHAHRVQSAHATAKGLVFGTPSYMSPEQARGSRHLDQRCDLWALATIAYEAACSEMPLEGRDTDELMKNLCAGRIVPIARRIPELGPRLGAFFAKAFADSVDARYQSAAELAAAFDHAVGVTAPGTLVVPTPMDASPVLAQSQGQSPRSSALTGAPSNAQASAPLEHPAPPPPRRRTALIAAGALAVVFAALGLAWRAIAGAPEPVLPAASSAVPASVPAASSASLVGAAAPSPGTPGTDVLQPPAVPVSALPRAPTSPYGQPPPSPAPSPRPAAPAAPPAPAPAPTKKDRSEVF